MDDPFEDGVGSVVATSADRYDEVVVAIIPAVAMATELSLLELPPLSNIGADPETLDVLFHPFHGPSRRFSFQYAGYLVSLFGDGALTVHPLDERLCARSDGTSPGR